MKAMGGVGISQAEDFSAVYYNPANLPYCSNTIITVGYQNIGTHFHASTEAPEQLGQTHIAFLGACLKLPLNLALGVYGSFGAVGPMTLQFRTVDSKLRMPLYDYSLRPPSAGLGLGYRPFKWLSIGIATSMTVHANFSQKIILPAQEKLEIDIHGTVRPTLPFVGGISVEPLPGLKIAAVFRSARYNKFEDVANTQVSVGDRVKFDIKQFLEGSFGFSPMQAGAGISYRFLDIVLASDITWYQWSQYKGAFLRVMPAQDTNSRIIIYPPEEDYGFFNIVIPRFGAEYVWQNTLSARAGYGYRLSPAPAPHGIANLIDSTAHMFSCGGGYKLILKKVTIDADIFFTSHVATRRKLEKYSFGGWAYDTGLALSIEY